MATKFNTIYDRKKTDDGFTFKEPSLTDSAYASMCDINQILLGQNLPLRTPVFGKENDWEFEDWQNEKARLKRTFLGLDEETRKKFGTPANFLAYCSNPDNFTREDGKLMFKDISEEKQRRKNEKMAKEYEIYLANKQKSLLGEKTVPMEKTTTE
ncbi:MAG: hypothetical protein ACK5NU_05090 [Fusobacterium ulcerans]|uniref:hypothetical protein n=1 Tax=Fusobacterium ulcerans TaxID=861 RepID=UPI003A8A5C4A